MEFSKYKKFAPIVRRIVELNHEDVLSKLYNYVKVPFIPTFEEAIRVGRVLSATRNAVVATHLTMEHYKTRKKEQHAVSLWFNPQGRGFLFDPNGEVDQEGIWVVYKYNNYETMRRIFGIRTSAGVGPQIDCPHTPGYIHNGGFCEFYNLLLMEQWYKDLGDHQANIEHFPSEHYEWMREANMAEYSTSVLKRVFHDV